MMANFPNHEISALVFPVCEMIDIDSLHQQYSDASIKYAPTFQGKN